MDELILIDDDSLIGDAWEMIAKRKGIRFHFFTSVDDFLAQADAFNKNSPVYVDYLTKNVPTGIDDAKRIHDAGFLHIFLTTAFPKEQIQLPDFIEGVCGKIPPWR